MSTRNVSNDRHGWVEALRARWLVLGSATYRGESVLQWVLYPHQRNETLMVYPHPDGWYADSSKQLWKIGPFASASLAKVEAVERYSSAGG